MRSTNRRRTSIDTRDRRARPVSLNVDAVEGVEREVPADDRDLLEAARLGSRTAVAELWRRHRPAAHRYAASLTRRFDPDDLVSEAFTRVFSTLQRGGGPTDALRPYLLVTIRNVAITWAKAPESRPLDDAEDVGYEPEMDRGLIEGLDRDMLQRALALLPEQWRQILWATEIDGKRPADLSSALGLQPNSVAALAYRAREALKHAWVQVHVPADRGEGEHRWVRERTGRYVHHALTPRQMERFRTHIDECPPCDEIVGGARRLAVLPVGLAALALPLGWATPPHETATTVAASSRRAAVRLRRGARRVSKRALSIAGAASVAAGVIVAGALIPAPGPADDGVPRATAASAPASPASAPGSTSPPGPGVTTLPAPTEDGPRGGDAVSPQTSSPAPSVPAPPSTTGRVLAEGPRTAPVSPGGPSGIAPAPTPAPTPTASPSTAPATATTTTTFTVSTIAPGSSGTAVVEIRNDEGPVRQRADTVRGSTVTLHAPPGTTFVPRSALRNDYHAADTPRSESALDIGDCTVADDLRTLACSIDARDAVRSADRPWVWRSGDSRVFYVDVAVDPAAATGPADGAAQLHLMTDDGAERNFHQEFTVDVATPGAPPAPAVRSIDPTGTDLVVAGTASPRCRVSVDAQGRELASVLADDDGRWSAAILWRARGTFVAEATCP